MKKRLNTPHPEVLTAIITDRQTTLTKLAPPVAQAHTNQALILAIRASVDECYCRDSLGLLHPRPGFTPPPPDPAYMPKENYHVESD